MKDLKKLREITEIHPMEAYINRQIHVDTDTIKRYFSHTKYRGVFFVELKTQCAEMLRKQGFTMDRISKTLNYTDHAVIVHHLFYKKRHKKIVDEVKNNMEDWLILQLYPQTSGELEYELKKKSEFCGYLKREISNFEQ